MCLFLGKSACRKSGKSTSHLVPPHRFGGVGVGRGVWGVSMGGPVEVKIGDFRGFWGKSIVKIG